MKNSSLAPGMELVEKGIVSKGAQKVTRVAGRFNLEKAVSFVVEAFQNNDNLTRLPSQSQIAEASV